MDLSPGTHISVHQAQIGRVPCCKSALGPRKSRFPFKRGVAGRLRAGGVSVKFRFSTITVRTTRPFSSYKKWTLREHPHGDRVFQTRIYIFFVSRKVSCSTSRPACSSSVRFAFDTRDGRGVVAVPPGTAAAPFFSVSAFIFDLNTFSDTEVAPK